MAPKKLAISILIPTHGRPGLLQRSVQSLCECELPESFRQLIVVENGSRAGAEQVVKKLPVSLNARYLHYEVGNKSAALNYALKQIDSDDLVIFFDDDVRLAPQVLMAYEQAAIDHPGQHFFAGPAKIDYETPPEEFLIPYLPPSAVGWEWSQGDVISSPSALGCNWAAYRESIIEVGGFDDSRGPGAKSGAVGQETAMLYRLLANGIDGRYVSDALVWHYVPKDRCNEKWLLNRVHRQGIGFGLEYDEHCATLSGIPRWMIREYIQRGLQLVAARVSSTVESKFKAQYDFNQIAGMIAGVRKSRVN